MLYIGRGACGMTMQFLYDGHVALGAEPFPTSDGDAPSFPRKCISLLRQEILYRSPVSRLPFPNAAFDLVVVNELIENKDPVRRDVFWLSLQVSLLSPFFLSLSLLMKCAHTTMHLYLDVLGACVI